MKLDPAQLRVFAERYTAAWCSQNPAQVAGFFSPEGSLQVNDSPPAVGPNEITAVAQGFMTAFPDMTVQMDDLVIKRDRATYHWTLTGTNSGPGGSGRKVRISGFEEWEFAPDGLIVRSLGHFDAAEYQRQLGREG